jgi:hypothetical protein
MLQSQHKDPHNQVSSQFPICPVRRAGTVPNTYGYSNVQGGKKEREANWIGMLNRLSQVITPQQVRDAAVDVVGPKNLELHLHNHVAGLMVKHGIATWDQLRTRFPGEHLLVLLSLGHGTISRLP